jgi:hypothetical protein
MSRFNHNHGFVSANTHWMDKFTLDGQIHTGDRGIDAGKGVSLAATPPHASPSSPGNTGVTAMRMPPCTSHVSVYTAACPYRLASRVNAVIMASSFFPIIIASSS